MASTRRLLGRIPPKGRLSSQERAARLVARKIRFGRRIQLHQVGSVPQTPFEKREYVKRLRAIIEKRRTLKKTSSQYEKLTTKAQVLQLSQQIGLMAGGRKPTVFQMIATVILHSGIDSQEVVRTMRSMQYIYKYQPNEVTWEGVPSNISAPIRQNLSNGRSIVSNIERVLHDNKRELDSEHVARLLGLDFYKKNQGAINAAMQILETAGLARKLPDHTLPKGSQLSVWIHRAHSNPRIHYPNSQIELLRALYQKKGEYVPITTLHKLQSLRRKTPVGNPSAKVSSSAAHRTIRGLEEGGLVRLRRSTKTIKEKKRIIPIRVIEVALSPLGERYMDEYQETNHLPEGIRKLLLGEKK